MEIVLLIFFSIILTTGLISLFKLFKELTKINKLNNNIYENPEYNRMFNKSQRKLDEIIFCSDYKSIESIYSEISTTLNLLNIQLESEEEDNLEIY